MGDEPTASTLGAPETIIISPEPSPERSLQPNPQREPTTHFPLASVGETIFAIDITGLVGEGQQQGGSLETAPDAPPLSTTLPIDEPSARASTSEPILVEEEPASTGTGTPTSATNVAGKGEATSPQLDTGKSLALVHTLYFLHFFLLELQPWSQLISLLGL